MDVHEYEEEMDYVYTNQQPLYFSTPPAPGTFAVPLSFFEKPYTKTATETNNVCDLLMEVHLCGEEEQEEKSTTPELDEPRNVDLVPEEEENSLVLYTSSSLPRREESVEDTPPQQFASRPNDFNLHSSVEQQQNHIPTTTTPPSLLSSPTERQPSYYTPPTLHHHNTPTFYFNFPAPADPMKESQGKIHFIAGLYKMVVKTLGYGAATYISGYIILNFHKDVQEKVSLYFSGYLNTQKSCSVNYFQNECHIFVRPVLIDQCNAWEHCMNQPFNENRSRALGETLGEMLDGFASAISYKAMAFVLLFGIGFFWIMLNSSKQREKQQLASPIPQQHIASSNIPRLQMAPL